MRGFADLSHSEQRKHDERCRAHGTGYGNFRELKKRDNAADREAAEAEALRTGGEPGTVAFASLIQAAT